MYQTFQHLISDQRRRARDTGPSLAGRSLCERRGRRREHLFQQVQRPPSLQTDVGRRGRFLPKTKTVAAKAGHDGSAADPRFSCNAGVWCWVVWSVGATRSPTQSANECGSDLFEHKQTLFYFKGTQGPSASGGALLECARREGYPTLLQQLRLLLSSLQQRVGDVQEVTDAVLLKKMGCASSLTVGESECQGQMPRNEPSSSSP